MNEWRFDRTLWLSAYLHIVFHNLTLGLSCRSGLFPFLTMTFISSFFFSDSKHQYSGILSLIKASLTSRPWAIQSYLQVSNLRLVLKLFRGEPAISGFDWNFSATHSSSAAFSTEVGSVPPWNFFFPLQLTMGRSLISEPIICNNAFSNSLSASPELKSLTLLPARSPDRSTKVPYHALTRSTCFVGRIFRFFFSPRECFCLSFTVLCFIGHWVVFRVGEIWSPVFPTRFHVSGRTLDHAALSVFTYVVLFSLTGLPMPFG